LGGLMKQLAVEFVQAVVIGGLFFGPLFYYYLF
jgi:hypothetical protein